MRAYVHSTSARALHLAGQAEDGRYFRQNPRATHRVRPPIGVEREEFGGERLLVINILANRVRVPIGPDETDEEIAGFVSDFIGIVWQQQHGAEARA
jgi:hypothetical protein